MKIKPRAAIAAVIFAVLIMAQNYMQYGPIVFLWYAGMLAAFYAVLKLIKWDFERSGW